MCGRYTLDKPGQLQSRFHTQNDLELAAPRYNVAPGSMMPVITHATAILAETMRWGLVPFWAKDPRIGYRLINARAETVMDKPSFKHSFHTKRCLVPATGFYEWQHQNGKQPYYFHAVKEPLFSFAGLFDEWRDAEGKSLKTFTILTTQANKLMNPIHNRMPVILTPDQESVWLSPVAPTPDLLNLLHPPANSLLTKYPVSSKVNSPTNDAPALIKPSTD